MAVRVPPQSFLKILLVSCQDFFHCIGILALFGRDAFNFFVYIYIYIYDASSLMGMGTALLAQVIFSIE